MVSLVVDRPVGSDSVNLGFIDDMKNVEQSLNIIFNTGVNK